MPINDLWWEFGGTMSLLQTKYVPGKLTSKIFTHAWFTKACKTKVRKKKLYIKAKKINLTSDWNNFREAAAVAKRHEKKHTKTLFLKPSQKIAQQTLDNFLC